MKRIKLRLTLDVVYEPQTTTEAELRNQLYHLVDFSANRGLLTGETDAKVVHWTAKIPASKQGGKQ